MLQTLLLLMWLLGANLNPELPEPDPGQWVHFTLKHKTYTRYCGGAPSLEEGSWSDPVPVEGVEVSFLRANPDTGEWELVYRHKTDEKGEVHTLLPLGRYCVKLRDHPLYVSNTQALEDQLLLLSDSLNGNPGKKAKPNPCALNFDLLADQEAQLLVESEYHHNCPWQDQRYNGPLPN